MTDSLQIILDDVVAGTVERRPQGRLRFNYDAEYQEYPGHTPISLSMPIEVTSHPDQTITPWLWGLLPDSESVIQRWAREFQVSASSPFSLLSTPIGDDCAGAVRFLNSEGNSRSQNREGAITWLSDDDVAERLRELRADSTDWLGRSFTGQFSLAGAQAKTALLYRDGRWGVPSGEIPTTHILKPAVSGLDDHDLNEHLCLDSANRAGLIAAQTTISTFGQETAVVVERYDRFIEATGTVKRVHQEDFCQALGIRPGRKYQNEGGPTPDDISRLLRDSMPSDVGENAIWRFADALAWNWIIGGTDAHSKNYSLLLAGRDVRFAPIYDVASALPYGSHEKKLRLAMKIGASYDVYTRRNTWPGAAKALGLNAELLIQRVGDLARVAPDAFSDTARDPAVADLNRDLPGKLTDLVAERSSRCLSLLTRSAN